MKNKERKIMLIFLNISGLILVFLTYLSGKYPYPVNTLGGSLVLIFMISGIIGLSYFVKALTVELNMLALIISGTVIINFFGYLERLDTKIFSEYIGFLLFCMLTIFLILIALFARLIKQLSDGFYELGSIDKLDIDETNKELKKKIILILIGPFMIIMSVVTFVMTGAEYLSFNKNLLTINLAFIVFAFVFTLICFSKVDDNNIKKIIIDKKYQIIKCNSAKIKKYIILFLILIVILGSMIEIYRGLWVLWFETVLILGLVLSIVWKVLKHVFYVENSDGSN